MHMEIIKQAKARQPQDYSGAISKIAEKHRETAFWGFNEEVRSNADMIVKDCEELQRLLDEEDWETLAKRGVLVLIGFTVASGVLGLDLAAMRVATTQTPGETGAWYAS